MPGLVGQVRQLVHGFELAGFSGERRVVPGGLAPQPARRDVRVLAAAVAAGQPATRQRAPRQHAEAVLLGGRQHVALDLAGEDRVRRLLGDRTLAAARFSATHCASTICEGRNVDVPM